MLPLYQNQSVDLLCINVNINVNVDMVMTVINGLLDCLNDEAFFNSIVL